MNTEIEKLKADWENLLNKLNDQFDTDLDLQGVIFLVGVQELGKGWQNFSRDQKQDVMHVGTCKLLSQFGHYEFDHTDEDGWPHFKQLKAMPDMNAFEQENFLKDHILLYFENHTPNP